ncbi:MULTISPECIES: type VII secretion protein EccE [Nocardiaceae]|uniref:Type VII secretion system protein EccE domain-containing protein n=1 Tax=Rhodococcoides kroppenstedtii TaxID=293050 RepID=A0ABS7NNS4_9NOCA|nr:MULTISPECIES: type VII secretion protein EccE [Rhodococcus]AMY19630.1 hypothetical protein A3Q40_02256 [Rhodococcus sp. PBTS 1]MBY6312253.1 hypothetical protein [Rhodococcus kroppenstedtii]MBY6319663.1 hypothetical protein [Rhodococcus kroppenstedtii]MBY6398346.1 hypothetical protein [Rhodococcus kroppenstedtii]
MLRAQYIGSPAADDAAGAADARPTDHARVTTATAVGTLVGLGSASIGAPTWAAFTVGAAVTAAVLVVLATMMPPWSRARTTTTLSLNVGGRPTAVVWDGGTASVTVDLAPTRAEGWTVLDGDTAEPDLAVPVSAFLSRTIDGDEAPVDLVLDTVTRRPDPTTRPGATYLPITSAAGAVAGRTTRLTLVLDVAHAAPAIARRGGGSPGLAAVLGLHLGRLEQVAAEHHVGFRPLDVDDLDHLGVASVPLRWWTAPIRRRTERTATTAVAQAEAASWWLTSAGSSPRGCLLVGSDDEARSLPGTPRARVPARGVGPAHGRRPARLRPLHPDALDTVTVPVAGCGQLIGVQDDGRGVTVRLWGPGVRRVAVAVDTFVLFQLVWRAVATGASVVVLTDRPAVWRSVIAAAGDTTRLSVRAPHQAPDPGTDLLVRDHAGADGPDDRTCVLTTTGDDDVADIALVQEGGSDRVRCRVGTRTTTLRLVSTAAETEVIGRAAW